MTELVGFMDWSEIFEAGGAACVESRVIFESLEDAKLFQEFRGFSREF